MLKYHIHITFIGRQGSDVFVVQIDTALGRSFQAGDHAQQSGFAAAGRTEQRNKFSIVNCQIERGDNDVITKFFVIPCKRTISFIFCLSQPFVMQILSLCR